MEDVMTVLLQWRKQSLVSYLNNSEMSWFSCWQRYSFLHLLRNLVVSNYTATEWSKQNNEFGVSDTLPASDSMRPMWHCGSVRPCSEHTPAVGAQHDPTETGRRRPACPVAVPLSCLVCWEPAAWYQAPPTPTSTHTTQTFLQDLGFTADELRWAEFNRLLVVSEMIPANQYHVVDVDKTLNITKTKDNTKKTQNC